MQETKDANNAVNRKDERFIRNKPKTRCIMNLILVMC